MATPHTPEAALPTPSSPQQDEQPFDLLLPLRSAGSLENPYPVYQLLRTVHPVLEVPVPGSEGPGTWLLTRHADVHAALRDPRFSVDRTRAPIVRDNLERLPAFIRQGAAGLRSMLVMDPPDHTRLRKLANKAFTPKRVAALQARTEQIVEELLDGVSGKPSFDLIHELAEPLPAIVIAELLGVPAEDHRQFRRWSSELIASIGLRLQQDERSPAQEAGERINAYLADIIAKRRKQPQDDLISAMIEAQEEKDTLSDAELLATSNLLLLAGHETTTNLIGNGMLALLREPRQLARLRGEPGLMPSAIEELLRFDGPVQATVRVAKEDIEIDGHRLQEGALVLVSIGAANHDPEVFEAPDELDLARDPNPHLGFGFGVHFCMGAALARQEATAAFHGLLARFPEIRLVNDEVEYRPNPILRGLRALEIGVS